MKGCDASGLRCDAGHKFAALVVHIPAIVKADIAGLIGGGGLSLISTLRRGDNS